MRDRLIELLDDLRVTVDVPINVDEDGCGTYEIEGSEYIADHLIENGVIVPPCKVGDTVWKITDIWHLDDRESWTYHYEKEVLEFRVRSISISCNSKGIWTKKFRICQVKNGKTIDNQYNIKFCDFGKSVFLSKEVAEKALRGEGE